MSPEHVFQSSLRQLFLHLQRVARHEALSDVAVYSIEDETANPATIDTIHLTWGEDGTCAELTLDPSGGSKVEAWIRRGPRRRLFQRAVGFQVERDGYRVAGGEFRTPHHAAHAVLELLRVAIGIAEGGDVPAEWSGGERS